MKRIRIGKRKWMNKIPGVLLLMVFLVSCTHKIYVPVEHRTVETVMVRDTVVNFQLELIKDSVVSPDTLSFLENKYASSLALYSNGKLTHNLQTRQDSFQIRLQYVEKEIKVEIPVPYPVETIKKVEKKLTVWQKLKLMAGEILLVLIIGMLVIYKIKK